MGQLQRTSRRSPTSYHRFGSPFNIPHYYWRSFYSRRRRWRFKLWSSTVLPGETSTTFADGEFGSEEAFGGNEARAGLEKPEYALVEGEVVVVGVQAGLAVQHVELELEGERVGVWWREEEWDSWEGVG